MTNPHLRFARPAAVLLGLCLTGALAAGQGSRPPAAAAAAPLPVFTDVTADAGIRFRHNSGAFGKKYLPETMGAGVAFLDVDNDGLQDLLFVNSTNWPGQTGAPSHPALYRNKGNGTFDDITKAAGLAVELYGMGVTAADFDNDGLVDIYLTAVGPNRLFKNMGKARFTEVTKRAGVGDPGFSASAMWVDYDNDGWLDLYVTNYVEWSIATDRFCSVDGKSKSYCTPEAYEGQSPTLYRNRRDGTFENVTKAAGLYAPSSKALGVALLDYNGDDRPDIFVANDTQPNRLYENKGNGAFADVAVAAGVAFSDAGVARAGMGVDAADVDGSGRPSLVIGNFSHEMIALYANEGDGLFIDVAPGATIGKTSLLTLAFACVFLDYDLDGLLDILAINGHVVDDISRAQPQVTHAQPAHLFRNRGGRRFDAVTPSAGRALQTPVVGRGAAYGDYDNDGDLDVAITTNNGPARLLRNDGGSRNGLIRVTAVGTKANRSAIGTRVRVSLDDGRVLSGLVKTGSSYLSQSELPLTFGLGRATKITALEVTWPGGRVERVNGAAANQHITIQEGKGIVRTESVPSKGAAR
jgi:hypothetical protein